MPTGISSNFTDTVVAESGSYDSCLSHSRVNVTTSRFRRDRRYCTILQEKFERIAATRRRQKEHHKRFLAALKAKRVQEEVSGCAKNCRLSTKCTIQYHNAGLWMNTYTKSGHPAPPNISTFLNVFKRGIRGKLVVE